MTDKPFDHEEYTRERLRQTTPGHGHLFSEDGDCITCGLWRSQYIEQLEQSLAAERERADRWKSRAVDTSENYHLLTKQLQAERERAEKAEGMVQWWKEEARHMEDVLQAEREKSAHLEREK